MRFTLDTHTHTIASGHAYNTIDEMAVYAAGHGVTHLAITDHAPKMPGSAVLDAMEQPADCYRKSFLQVPFSRPA